MARYGKDHKGQTRRRILDLASKRFRADGIDGVGIASLMAEAGLTNGGFYAHFASKEELVKEAMVHALSEIPGEAGRAIADDTRDLPAFIDTYLSAGHKDNSAEGCAVAALSPEMVRQPEASRAAFLEQGMAIVEKIADGLPGAIEPAERIPRAIAVMSHLIGSLQMARFMTDRVLSEAVLARGRAEALRIAGFDAVQHDVETG